MVLRPHENFPEIPCCTLQTLPDLWSGPTAVLEWDRNDEDALRLLAQDLGPKLVLPEVWQDVFPYAGVLISSSISGGTLGLRLQEAAIRNPQRCWLLVEPMQMQFSLPCPAGVGMPICRPHTEHSFDSEALCCQYTHFIHNGHGAMVLWDTEQTLQRKLELAQYYGFQGYTWPNTNRLDFPIKL